MSTTRSNTRAEWEAYLRYRATCEQADASCWICTQPIDYEAPGTDYKNPSRFQRDHYQPVSTHPELENDPANWRPSHAGCNRDRSNKAPRPPLGDLSEQWT